MDTVVIRSTLMAGATVLVLASSLVLGGCTSSGPSVADQSDANGMAGVPRWVTNPPSGNDMVYGVGSAEVFADPATALNRARDKARSELIKQLKVTVSGQTEMRQSQKINNGKSQVTSSIMDIVRSRVAETELANIGIAETHVDSQGSVAYALAQLDRNMAARNLADQLDELDERIRRIADETTGDDRLEQLKVLMPALPLLTERENVFGKLRLVAKGNPGHRMPAEFRALQDRVASLLDSLVVVLEPRDISSRKMDSTLRRALSEEGVKVRESGAGDLILRYEAGLRTVTRDGRSFVFADGNVTVLDAAGNVIDEFQERVKSGSVDAGVASDRAVGKLAEGLGQKLGASLLDSFNRAGGQ